jgi:hypothetical protein
MRYHVFSLHNYFVRLPYEISCFLSLLEFHMRFYAFLDTVFNKASVFDGDLNQWDIANVTTMSNSKSKHMVEL